MSEKLPAVKSREVISALGRLGFRETRRSKGSHVQLADEFGPTRHRPRPLKRGHLLRADDKR